MTYPFHDGSPEARDAALRGASLLDRIDEIVSGYPIDSPAVRAGIIGDLHQWLAPLLERPVLVHAPEPSAPDDLRQQIADRLVGWGVRRDHSTLAAEEVLDVLRRNGVIS